MTFTKYSMKKLKCILLIDDDRATNYAHATIIDRANCCDQVICKRSGREALDYLQEVSKSNYIRPELVLLDINMPGMNGWEFLDEYLLMRESFQANAVIVMLTSSLNPDDQEKATSYQIKHFLNKPLSIENLQGIISDNF